MLFFHFWEENWVKCIHIKTRLDILFQTKLRYMMSQRRKGYTDFIRDILLRNINDEFIFLFIQKKTKYDMKKAEKVSV